MADDLVPDPETPDNAAADRPLPDSSTPKTPPSDAPAGGLAPVPQTSDGSEEELPEYEELTPELMEDECLRGDAMLRGALILLALLLGWTNITESNLLVQIRTGEYMLSHGILPPRTDVFSATAADRSWVNLHWLSDLLIGGLHQSLGMAALSVLGAVTVAIAFWMLGRISLPGVSTWWGSFCGFAALLALIPIFQPGPATWTLLGLTLLMLCCARVTPAFSIAIGETSAPFSLSFALLPILFLFWTNLDSRSWIGVALLLLFLIGDACTRALRKLPQSRQNWGIFLICAVVAFLVSPWPGRPAIEFLNLLPEQAAIRAYGGISEFFPQLRDRMQDRIFWRFMSPYKAAALFLLAAALVTMGLNIKRLNFGWLTLWVGTNALVFADGTWLCYAAVVNAVIATINGQDWYRNQYPLTYSIDTWSVLWGRGGRALMVLGFFLTAYLGINGALMGPEGRRLGSGLDPRWTNRIRSLETRVLAHSFSDRNFPTIPSQGDVLIWMGKQPFVDSRLSLYLNGKEDLIDLHQRVRSSLFSSASAEAEKKNDAELWKATLAKYETYDLLVRLWGPLPPYDPMVRMLSNPDWTMTGLGAAGANFTRNDLPDPKLKAFVKKYQADHFVEEAYRPTEKPHIADLQAVWPAPVSSYDQWLIQKLDVAPNAAQLAAHYDAMFSVLNRRMSIDQVSAMALLTVRDCRQALEENPNHPLAYRALVGAYSLMQQVEQQITEIAGQQPEPGPFNTQILGAAYAAVEAGGENPVDLQRLLDILLVQNQHDTALAILHRYEAALKEIPVSVMTPDQQTELEKLKAELQAALDKTEADIEKAREGKAPKAQLVAMALQAKCPSLALRLLQEDLTALQQAPELKILYASLLLKTGDIQSALQEIEGLESTLNAAGDAPAVQPILAQWREVDAAAHLVAHNLQQAAKLWKAEQNAILRRGLNALMQMPFAAASLPIQHELWAAYYGRMAATAALDVPERWAQLQLQCARADLELGRLGEATKLLQQILKECPQFSRRTVVAFYLGQLTNRKIEEFLPKAKPAPQQKQQTPAAGESMETSGKKSSEVQPGKGEAKDKSTDQSKTSAMPEQKTSGKMPQLQLPAEKSSTEKPNPEKPKAGPSEKSAATPAVPPRVPVPERLPR